MPPTEKQEFHLTEDGTIYKKGKLLPVTLDSPVFYLELLRALTQLTPVALPNPSADTRKDTIQKLLDKIEVREFRFGKEYATSIVSFLISCAEAPNPALVKLKKELETDCERYAMQAGFLPSIDTAAFALQTQKVDEVVQLVKQLHTRILPEQKDTLLREIAFYFSRSTEYQVDWPQQILQPQNERAASQEGWPGNMMRPNFTSSRIFWENLRPTLFLEPKYRLDLIGQYFRNYPAKNGESLFQVFNDMPTQKTIPFPRHR